VIHDVQISFSFYLESDPGAKLKLRFRLIYFFFQAEDGIRDLTVTGVQTCALPISGAAAESRRCRPPAARIAPGTDRIAAPDRARSEERRVGKECRSRWSAYN